MSVNHSEHADANGVEDLTPEEARRKRELFLAQMKDSTGVTGGVAEQIDAADAAMATLILPGG